MGTSKSEEFSVRDNRVANYAKSLSHPARIAILRLLIQKQSCICGDLVIELPLSQSTVSQHLKELKDAGIIKGDISGPKTCYCINPDIWNEMQTILNTFFNEYNETNNTCC